MDSAEYSVLSRIEDTTRFVASMVISNRVFSVGDAARYSREEWRGRIHESIIAQETDRLLSAHSTMESSIKHLIKRTGTSYKYTHDLGILLWSAWPNAFSSWADADAYTQVVRCGMGDGSTDFKVWARSKTSGLQFKTPSYQRNLGLPWHVADEELTYHLTTPWIPDATSTVSAADQQTYSDSFDQAIAAWNAVQSASPASDSFAIATPALSSPTTANLVVRGHQTPTTNATDPCGNYEYIACVVLIGSGNYPHMGQQYLYFDRQPHGKMYNRTWTTSFNKARTMTNMYLHMPIIMTHEFGHAAGLWHDSTSGNTMYRGVVGVPPTGSDLLKEGDIKALLSIYDNHTVNN